MVKKYSSDLELVNIYFSDDTVYYEFSKKDLPEAFFKCFTNDNTRNTGMEEINLL